MEKVQINLVYTPGTRPQHKVFENAKGIIYHSKNYDASKINVGMGWYSIRNPRPADSILVVEPYCILPKDYEVGFLKKFRKIFTWATKAMTRATISGKVVPVFHPTYHSIPDFKKLSAQFGDWDKRDDEIVIIANNKSAAHHSELYSLRTYLADVLDAYSKYKVSWYGQIPINRPYYRGEVKNKKEILSRVKFSICTENSYDPKFTHNYFTEKMPDVWASGAVPIYMGCYNIDEIGPTEGSYIDLRPLVEKHQRSWKIKKQQLNNMIVNFDNEQYQNYVSSLHKIHDSGILRKHAYDNLYNKMINTFFNSR